MRNFFLLGFLLGQVHLFADAGTEKATLTKSILFLSELLTTVGNENIIRWLYPEPWVPRSNITGVSNDYRANEPVLAFEVVDMDSLLARWSRKRTRATCKPDNFIRTLVGQYDKDLLIGSRTNGTKYTSKRFAFTQKGWRLISGSSTCASQGSDNSWQVCPSGQCFGSGSSDRPHDFQEHKQSLSGVAESSSSESRRAEAVISSESSSGNSATQGQRPEYRPFYPEWGMAGSGMPLFQGSVDNHRLYSDRYVANTQWPNAITNVDAAPTPSIPVLPPGFARGVAYDSMQTDSSEATVNVVYRNLCGFLSCCPVLSLNNIFSAFQSESRITPEAFARLDKEVLTNVLSGLLKSLPAGQFNEALLEAGKYNWACVLGCLMVEEAKKNPDRFQVLIQQINSAINPGSQVPRSGNQEAQIWL